MLRELHRWSDDAGRAPLAPDAALAQLDRADMARVVVVAAPPGAGASDTVRCWLAGRSDLRSAWLRLEDADADEAPASLCTRIWDELRAELDHGAAGVPTVLVLEGIDRLQTARGRLLVSTIACLPPAWQVVAVSRRPAADTVMPTSLIPYASLGARDLAVDRAAGHRLLAAASIDGRFDESLTDAVHDLARGWRAVWVAAAGQLERGTAPADLAAGWAADAPELVEVGCSYLGHLTTPEVHSIEDHAILGRPCGGCDAPRGPVASDLAELARTVGVDRSSGHAVVDGHAVHPVVAAAARVRARDGSWARRHLHLLGDRDALRTAGTALARTDGGRRSRADRLDLGARGLLLAGAGLVEQAATAASCLGGDDPGGLGDLVVAATAGLALDGSALAAAVRLWESADRTWPTLRHLGVRSADAQQRLARDLAAVATERIAGRTSIGTSPVTDALRRAGVGAHRGAVSPA